MVYIFFFDFGLLVLGRKSHPSASVNSAKHMRRFSSIHLFFLVQLCFSFPKKLPFKIVHLILGVVYQSLTSNYHPSSLTLSGNIFSYQIVSKGLLPDKRLLGKSFLPHLLGKILDHRYSPYLVRFSIIVMLTRKTVYPDKCLVNNF